VSAPGFPKRCSRVLLYRPPSRLLLVLIATSAAFCTAAQAQEIVVAFDPAATKIDFTLGATLHTVHGTFQLKRGRLQFNRSTGAVSGEIVVDATSGNSENADRDKKMHKDVLESEKYPEITFVPSRVNGSVPAQGTGNVEVVGIMKLHGQEHPISLSVTVTRNANGDLECSTQFAIPYVKWGLKNPSTFILRVGDTVDVGVRMTAQVR
jgi:polyisoprenoid-binding protein YceI